MKKKVDKLNIHINKKLLIFLITLIVVGIILGSLFTIILSKSDKSLITDYLNTYVSNINNHKLDYISALKQGLTSNILFVLIIWLLGISVIGLPIIIFMFFSKYFIMGFTISSIITNFKIKGCLLSFIYIFPHYIINILAFLLLMVYSISLSLKIIKSLLKKKTIDFKVIMNKYYVVLIINLIVILLTTLYEVFIVPYLFNMFV